MTPQIPILPNINLDAREKRILSPTTITSPTAINEEKRRRDETDIIADGDGGDSAREPTMLDLKTYMDAIMARLNTTATKVDVSAINDKITAQNIEIDQLKSRMQKHEDDLKKIQATVDEEVAASLQRKFQTADSTTRMITTNMATDGIDREQRPSSTRRNLIVEGLVGETEDEMCTTLIAVCASIDVTMYKRDIELITRYKRRDETSKKPGPVNVTIALVGLRDNILRKKRDLFGVPEMAEVFINADETLEVRRAKSTLRKVSKTVKTMGDPIVIKHDRIQINGIWYTTNDIAKIPEKYMQIRKEDEGAVGGDPSNSNKDQTAADGQDPPVSKKQQKRLIKRGEKMRITKAGLLFSGPSAYISNMSYAPIVVDDIPHDSNEEAFQYGKAKQHGCDGLAAAVLEMDDSYQIKRETADIVTTDKWKQDAPNKLWTLLDIKMREHPDLLER